MTGLHLSLVIPNCAITEYTFLDHPLNDLLSVEPIRPKHGYIEAPKTVGLGVRFDESLLEEFPYVPSPNTMISAAEQDIQLTTKSGNGSVREHRNQENGNGE